MAKKLELNGAFTALVTPFTPDGSAVDFASLEKIVNWQIEQGINGLVPMGTTGECPTVSHEEHDQIIAAVVQYTKGRVPVIAGTGSNSTTEALRLTRAAKEAGADACLVVNPYYNKPGQEGLYQHFKSLAQVGIPIIMYNIPARTGINMAPETVARLYNEFDTIVAIKEASGSLDQASAIASLCDIAILSGDDSLTLPLMSIGATGVISVLTNAAPKMILAITDGVRSGNMEAARLAHFQGFQLSKAMFLESNPQPIKAAMELLGLCSAAVRLPLTLCSEDTLKKVKQALQNSNLL